MVKISIKHILIILSIISIVFLIVPNYIYADTVIDGNFDEYKDKAKVEPAVAKAEVILGVLQLVGVASSVIALAIIGIKYMLGSVEEKADYKKTLIPYLIGAFLVFSVSALPKIIFDLLKDFH